MSILGQLFTPVAYLRIRHPVKAWFDWYIPLLLTVVCVAFILVIPKPIKLFGDHGVVFIITDLIKMLTGFYIAALAAVATFPRDSMDEPIEGEPVTLSVKRKGVAKKSELSRRRFLSYLFGYLAFMGLALYFVGAVSSLLGPNLTLLQLAWWGVLLKWCFVFGYLFFTINLLTTTLLGLHFLTDRIHR
jgi:hypothetical protein